MPRSLSSGIDRVDPPTAPQAALSPRAASPDCCDLRRRPGLKRRQQRPHPVTFGIEPEQLRFQGLLGVVMKIRVHPRILFLWEVVVLRPDLQDTAAPHPPQGVEVECSAGRHPKIGGLGRGAPCSAQKRSHGQCCACSKSRPVRSRRTSMGIRCRTSRGSMVPLRCSQFTIERHCGIASRRIPNAVAAAPASSACRSRHRLR